MLDKEKEVTFTSESDDDSRSLVSSSSDTPKKYKKKRKEYKMRASQFFDSNYLFNLTFKSTSSKTWHSKDSIPRIKKVVGSRRNPILDDKEKLHERQVNRQLKRSLGLSKQLYSNMKTFF